MTELRILAKPGSRGKRFPTRLVGKEQQDCTLLVAHGAVFRSNYSGAVFPPRSASPGGQRGAVGSRTQLSTRATAGRGAGPPQELRAFPRRAGQLKFVFARSVGHGDRRLDLGGSLIFRSVGSGCGRRHSA